MSPSTSKTPAKRKRNTSAEGSDSDVSEAEEAAPEPAAKKKAVLKYKAPTKKVPLLPPRAPFPPAHPHATCQAAILQYTQPLQRLASALLSAAVSPDHHHCLADLRRQTQ